jgi:branched-chain amino acid transport system substrate-binding protein
MLLALIVAAAIKIGVINSVTGPEAPIGESLTNGYTLAVEDLKAKGIQIDLVTEDDAGKPQIAMGSLEKLATRDGVSAIVGPYTSASSNAAARVAERSKIPLLIPAASKDEITKQGYKYVFRTSAIVSWYAQVLLDAATTFGKPKSVFIVHENTDFGTSAARGANEIAKKMKLEVVGTEAYSAGSPDYRPTLSKIKAANPDLVFMVSYVADAILLMRQSRELGLKPMAFLGGGAGFTTSQFASEKSISEGVLSSTQWTPDVKWAGAAEWGARYKKKFGKTATYHAACAYESLRILGEIANKAGGDREKIRAGLKAGKWDGILGEVQYADFDGFTNQNKHEMLVVQIQNGDFVTVFPKDLAKAKAVWPFPGFKQ